MNVVLGVSGELIERGAGRDVLSPSRELSVNSFASSEVFDSGGERSFEHLAIEHVVGGDLDVGDSRKNIKLGQVEGREIVNLVSVLDDIEVEPSALSLATSGGTEFISDILESFTNLIVEPCGERSSSDTSGVGLDDTDVAVEGRWRDTESSANSSDASAGRGDERPGTEVQVEHGGVSSFSNDTLGRVVEVSANVIDRVHEHSVLGAIELLGHLMELVELLGTVEFRDVELVLESVNEGVVLLLEEGPVSKISSTETDSESFGGIGWTDTHLGGANHSFLVLLESTVFLNSVSHLLDIGDEVSSGGDLQSTVVVDTVVVELLELTEHAGDV